VGTGDAPNAPAANATGNKGRSHRVTAKDGAEGFRIFMGMLG